MNKQLKCLVRGYVLFRTNGTYFLSYERGLRTAKATVGNVALDGFSIFKGWRCFWLRLV